MPPLQVTTELLRVGDLREVELTALVGPDVTMARVLDRMDRQHYDILLWSGHGTTSTLLLSDGAAILPYWLATQMARHMIPLAVLSTCESATRPETALLSLGFQDVLPANGVTVVAMSQNVLDRAAVAYDVALLQALVAGSNIRQGHQAGLEAAALAGNAAAPQLFVADTVETMAYPINSGTDQQLLRAMNDKMDRLSEQVHDISTRQQLLEAEVKRIVSDVTQLRSELADLHSGTFNLPKAYVSIFVVIMMVVLAALVSVTWRAL